MRPDRHLVVWTDADEIAGAEEALAVLVAHLPATVRVTVASPRRKTIDVIAAGRPEAGRRVVPRLAGKSDLGQVLQIRRVIAALRPDAIHFNKTEVADLRYVELLAHSIGATRLVSVVHHVEPTATTPARLLTRRLASRASATVAVGSGPARQLESILGLPPGRVEVIPNALPALEAQRDARPAGNGTDRLTIGVLARFVRHKAVDQVIAATAALDGVRLLVGGDGPERDRIEDQVRRLGVTDRVELLGWVPPERVLDNCDVVVSAARIEGHPMALLDGRRRGLPIVAADVGAVADIVEHRVTGFLTAPDDVTGMCAAIEGLAADPALRASMGRAARLAAETWTPQSMAAAYEACYWGELAPTGGATPPARAGGRRP